MGNRASIGEDGEEEPRRRHCHRPVAGTPEPKAKCERPCKAPCAARPHSPDKKPHSPNKKPYSPDKRLHSLDKLPRPQRYCQNSAGSRIAGSLVGVRCAERRIPNSSSSKAPVRLVVFDLDETLTLTTFMSGDGTYDPDQYELTAKVNFESPWVEGSRIERLRQMFEEMSHMKDGQQRTLAILTRNDNQGGVSAVVNLLRVANLAEHFAAIWSLPWRPRGCNGAYQQGGEWKFFDPPVNKVVDHKAHVLAHVGANLQQWLPHLGSAGGPCLPESLALEEIVLIDDQRANFQSSLGGKVLRYCKVARYDARYYDFGLLKDMGGIGARDARDFDLLVRFVEDPQDFRETLQCNCVQLDGSGRRPVSLVVFDFDETLTLATFMPEEKECQTQVGWTPKASPGCEWNEADLVTYNFESPWIEGSRVEKLQALLSNMTESEGDVKRTLVVCTRNSSTAVGVLNLLLLAGLADHFSAIWRFPRANENAEGLYWQAGEWWPFEIPFTCTADERLVPADILHHVMEHPSDWFPQLASDCHDIDRSLMHLTPPETVLIDDERANFWSNQNSGTMVMRYCKVMKYDKIYRDCGFMHNMGGIGANSNADFETVQHFVQRPWDFPYKGSRPQTLLPCHSVATCVSEESGTRSSPDEALDELEVCKTMTQKVPTMRRERASLGEEPPRTPRRRRTPLHRQKGPQADAQDDAAGARHRLL